MRALRPVVALLIVCGVMAGAASSAAADQVIFVVRHAERADGGGAPAAGMMATDPPLSAAGTERAKRLAAMLASADVKHIFTTEFARTRQTAAPLADAAKIKAAAISSKDLPALATQVRAADGNVLVVGHSNTVPNLLQQLGVQPPITIADNEYDNLFVVVRPAAGPPTLIRLRY